MSCFRLMNYPTARGKGNTLSRLGSNHYGFDNGWIYRFVRSPFYNKVGTRATGFVPFWNNMA